MEEDNRDGVDTHGGGGWIALVVGPELTSEAKFDGAQIFQSGVVGPHPVKDMCRIPKLTLNWVFLHPCIS